MTNVQKTKNAACVIRFIQILSALTRTYPCHWHFLHLWWITLCPVSSYVALLSPPNRNGLSPFLWPHFGHVPNLLLLDLYILLEDFTIVIISKNQLKLRKINNHGWIYSIIVEENYFLVLCNELLSLEKSEYLQLGINAYCFPSFKLVFYS